LRHFSNEVRRCLSEKDPLITYLATHDAPCPGCGYNLRGLSGSTCPECGRAIHLPDLLPKESEPISTERTCYQVFVIIALPVIAVAFFPVLIQACEAIWDKFVLNDKVDGLVSVAIACAAGLGVVYAIRRNRAPINRAKVRTQESFERAQNIMIGILLIAFAVAIVLICRMFFRFLGGIMGGAW